MSRVLIVDDDCDVTAVMQALMTCLGHVTATAADGSDALLKLTAFEPDVVLTDIEMPVLDGPGMMQRMLIENCGKERIPVVLISGVVDLSQVAAQCGTPYFLEKPVSFEHLQAVIDRALVERQPPRPPAWETRSAG